jgi:MFS family permease
MSDTAPTEPQRLFTYDFTILTLVATFGFCNIAVFYGFATYLARLGVAPDWRGLLLGAEPLAAFCLRPFLSVYVTPRNALALVRASLVGSGLALCAYLGVRDIGPLLLVRFFHGITFVCLVSGVTVLLVQTIPRRLSGRAFGYFSLASLVPYAVMPPLTEWLLARVHREDRAYAICSVLVLPALALLVPLGRHLGRRAMAAVEGPDRVGLVDLRRTLALVPVRLVLLANLAMFLCTTLVFFFFKPFAQSLRMDDPGLFFSVYTAVAIAMRLLAGPLYDRLPKEAVLVAALVSLAACMVGFAMATDPRRLLLLAGGYGVCLGLAMPLLSAVMFGHSPPAMRGTTMNLMLFMMDASYVFGPMAGGAILAGGAGFPSLFLVAAALALASGLLVTPLLADGWRTWRRGGP